MNRIYALFLVILPFFSACSFFGAGAGVLLVFPDFSVSGQYITIDHWKLIYPESCNEGIPSFAQVVIPADTSEVSLYLARGVNLPVLAYPVFSLSGGNLCEGGFPAAAFFPLDMADGGRLQLTWESGHAAEIVKYCCLNSQIYRGLDTARLREVLSEKAAEDSKGDIWMIAPQSILYRLGYGIFRESAVSIAESMEFGIPASAGFYVSDNPFQQISEVPDGGFLQIEVPVNRKTVFMSESGDEVISVYFDDSIWCWSSSATGVSESGRR